MYSKRTTHANENFEILNISRAPARVLYGSLHPNIREKQFAEEKQRIVAKWEF